MKERSPKNIVFLVLIVLVVAGAVVGAVLVLRTDSVEERVEKNQLVSFLFTVHDGDAVKVIEVFLYNPATKKGTMLFLPGNTWLMLESLNRYDKLEALYHVGKPQALIAKIERMIDVKIPYYLDLSRQDFVSLVDLLEGIEVLIPSPVTMTVDGRMFLFESGSVVLDGDKAADFLEMNLDGDTDMERAQRRQDLLKSLLARLKKCEISGLFGLPGVMTRLTGYVHANLAAPELKTLIKTLASMQTEGILYRRVHGTSRTQNKEEIFLPNDQGDQLRKTMAQAVEFLKNDEGMRPEDLIVNLEILNGTEIAFRARDCGRIYKKYGYEVLREDNAPEKPVAKTVVIDYKGNEKMAREIAAVIRCTKIEVRPDEQAEADVTIILGMDFDGQYCQ